MRRNTFWLAYCYERWQAASTGWAMALDDEDISQVLSLRMEDYENGVSKITNFFFNSISISVFVSVP